MRRLPFAILLLLAPTPAVTAFSAVPAAAPPEVSARISPGEVAVGESTTYTVTVQGGSGSGEPELPDLTGFTLAGSGTSSSFSLENGQVRHSTQYSYYLVPEQEGTFTLGPATVRQDGKAYESGPVDLKVVAAGSRSRPQAAPPAGPPGFPQFPQFPQFPGFPNLPSPFGGHREPLGAGDVGVDLSVDRDDPYVGEQVVLTLTFERAVNLMDRPDITPAPTPGFRAVPVEVPPGRDRRSEQRGGRTWVVEEHRWILFPLSAGEQTVGPAAVSFTVDPFAGSQRLVTKSVTLHVKPLPDAGRPADFSGGVGDFQLEAKLDRSDATVGDTVTLTVTVSGRGNFDDLTGVTAPDAPGFEVFDPEVESDLRYGPGGLAGARRYRFILVPRRAGNLEVGAVRLSTFDPAKGAYRTGEAGPFPLTVAAAPPATQAPAAPEPAAAGGKEDRSVEALAWAGLVFLVGVMLLVLRRWRRPEPEEGDPGTAAATRPDPARALAALEHVLAGPGGDGRAAALDRALRAYLGACWGIPAPRVDAAAAARHLAGDPAALTACREALAALQAARYAPEASVDVNALAAKVRVVIEAVGPARAGGAPPVRARRG